MNTTSLVGWELWHRKSQLISGLLAIMLGIAVIVGIHTVALESERSVAVSLDNLGANILVLPVGASVDDYYAADIDAPTFPEEYVEKILSSSLPGVDNLSPKLTRRLRLGVSSVVLTGILPANEIASKPLWQTAGFIGQELQASCDPSSVVNQSHGFEDERLQRKAIESLNTTDCLVGSAVAEKLGLSEGKAVRIEGQELQVAGILPETGTVDDSRVFAHLKTVQNILGIEEQISAIEIMGCCNAISDGLLGKLRNILPDTRIITISQIVSTQIETNQLMKKVSLIFLVLIIFVGGVSIGNFMWANVNERRKEIGILLMVGSKKSHIYSMFLMKASFLGLLGGILGYVIGTLCGVVLGRQLAGLSVHPLPILLLWSILLSVLIAVLGSLIPAYLAARTEPFANMREL